METVLDGTGGECFYHHRNSDGPGLEVGAARAAQPSQEPTCLPSPCSAPCSCCQSPFICGSPGNPTAPLSRLHPLLPHLLARPGAACHLFLTAFPARGVPGLASGAVGLAGLWLMVSCPSLMLSCSPSGKAGCLGKPGSCWRPSYWTNQETASH